MLNKEDVNLTAPKERNTTSSTLNFGESISMAHLVDNNKQETTNYDSAKENKYVNIIFNFSGIKNEAN